MNLKLTAVNETFDLCRIFSPKNKTPFLRYYVPMATKAVTPKIECSIEPIIYTHTVDCALDFGKVFQSVPQMMKKFTPNTVLLNRIIFTVIDGKRIDIINVLDLMKVSLKV